MAKEKEIKSYKSQRGYVQSLESGKYGVVLGTETGPQFYHFPKNLCPQPLKLNDPVRCYAVRTQAGLEIRLEKLVLPKLNKREVDAKFEAFRQRAIDTKFAEYQAKQRLRE